MTNPAKVMVGVSTFDGHSYCRHEFVERLKEIVPKEQVYIVYNGDDPSGFEDFKLDMYKTSGNLRGLDIMAAKQNMIRKEFLKKGSYTHLLMLESDNIPPKDVCERLLSHKKDIVSAMYFIKSTQSAVHHLSEHTKQALWREYEQKGSVGQAPDMDIALIIRQLPIPSLWGIFHSSLFAQKAGRLWTTEDYINFKVDGQRLVPILSSGVGCVLLSRKVVSEIPFRVKDPDDPFQQFTDFLFYTEAREKGIQAYVDIDTIAKHLHVHFADEYNSDKWFDTKTYKSLQ